MAAHRGCTVIYYFTQLVHKLYSSELARLYILIHLTRIFILLTIGHVVALHGQLSMHILPDHVTLSISYQSLSSEGAWNRIAYLWKAPLDMQHRFSKFNLTCLLSTHQKWIVVLTIIEGSRVSGYYTDYDVIHEYGKFFQYLNFNSIETGQAILVTSLCACSFVLIRSYYRGN